MTDRPSRCLRATVLSLAVAALVLLSAGTASADTSTAAANAVSGSLLGAASSGAVTASNTGDQPTVDTRATPAVTVLGTQTTVSAGLLDQQAVAYADGRSAACAGLVGAGGTITIGTDGRCVTTAGTSKVVLQITSLVIIEADAITSSCTAASDGTVYGRADLAGARVYALGAFGSKGALLTVLGGAPAANTGLSLLAGAVTLLSNEQATPAGPGSLSVTALHISLLGSTLDLKLASVSCGTNVKVLPTPAVPVHAASMAAGAAVVAAWALAARRVVRRRGLRVRR